MAHVRYGGRGGRKLALRPDTQHIVVRTDQLRRERSCIPVGVAGAELVDSEAVLRLPEVGVEVLRFAGKPAAAKKARAALKRDKRVRFAGQAFCISETGEPVVYTENFFVKFSDDVSTSKAKRTLKEYGLSPKRELPYAGNAWFAEAAEGTGRKVFDLAEALLQEEDVELCHPELIRRIHRRAAHPNQWHLHATTIGGTNIDAHASVTDAWALSRGNGVVVAVIDDGIDIDHEEFAGAFKIVGGRDVTLGTNDPRPRFGWEKHGTACAGVAVGNGNHQASGVAPDARLMPIRFVSNLGSQQEADAFVWAADHGADVISCSWGPPDRTGQVDPLPDSTRTAIDYAINHGRGGLGCVIAWAAGNGDESVDKDGYASYPKVIAVGACNDRGKRSQYSDMGDALWCAFPSNDEFSGGPRTEGIWTTDRRGSSGYSPTDYADDFGGTSSSCPGVAGVAALILAREPSLRWDQVKDILKQSCDRIDAANGQYGTDGHSPLYGYGRVNARAAVELAGTVPPTPTSQTKLVRHTTEVDTPIKDHKTSSVVVKVADSEEIQSARIRVDLEHTWRGDLFVTLVPPVATGVSAIPLHQGAGGSADDLQVIYDEVNAPRLAEFAGLSGEGTWTLKVEDRATRDTGKIRAFTVELVLAVSTSRSRGARKKKRRTVARATVS